MDELATTPDVAPPTEGAVSVDSAPAEMPSEEEIESFFQRHAGEEDSTPDPATDSTPADPSAADAPAATEDATDPTGEAATGGDTPGTEERGPIPYQRFQEVIQERNTAREQLEQLQTLAGYAPVIDRFQQAGATPEQILAYLDQTAQAQAQAQQVASPPPTPSPEATAPESPAEPELDPAEQLAAYWADRGVDVYELDAAEYAQREAVFQAHQAAEQAAAEAQRIRAELESERQARQQAEQRAEQERQAAEERARQEQLVAAYEKEMLSVKAVHPLFKDPHLEQALVGFWDTQPEGVTLTQAAETLASTLQTQYRNQLANEAVTKAQQQQAEAAAAAARPQVPGGGQSPSPAVKPDFATMDDMDLEIYVANKIAASNASVR